ncbi:MAG: CPBP family intramembrane metalloprotease [Lachnospiraceae bacterium]|nr:CPBP family intramembrane metalloprotease [Lachnospiraceae bacterium]
MKNKWNCMETILISGVLFAVFHFGFPTEGFITEKMILMTATLFVMGMAFAAVTCATGAIWASVTMYSAFSMLYGRTYILNIDTERDFNAIWNYTMKNENWLIAGFSGADGVRVGLTVLLAFLVVLLAALLQLRHSEAS